jgi:hypothetical protein
MDSTIDHSQPRTLRTRARGGPGSHGLRHSGNGSRTRSSGAPAGFDVTTHSPA